MRILRRRLSKPSENANTPKKKYNNKRIDINGEVFDSKREYLRYLYLLEAQKAGLISDLKRQCTYELIPNQYEKEVVHLKTKDKEIDRLLERKVCYIADFSYQKDGKIIVEDVKIGSYRSKKTNKLVKLYPPEYIIKRKLMLFRHGIKVKEVFETTESI